MHRPPERTEPLLGLQVGPGRVLGRVGGADRVPGGVLPVILQVPDIFVADVVAHVGEQHGGCPLACAIAGWSRRRPCRPPVAQLTGS